MALKVTTVLLLVVIVTLIFNGSEAKSVYDPFRWVLLPPLCPPGQQVINGRCVEVPYYDQSNNRNMIQVPDNCAAYGEVLVDGVCRQIWNTPNNFEKNNNMLRNRV